MKALSQLVHIGILAILLSVMFISTAPAWQVQAAGPILYVSTGGLTSGDCDSWINACDLQFALGLAVSGDEIWVSAGTYIPTTDGDRTKSFVFKNGVAIYGGFTGTETLLDQRDPSANVTILSGDLEANDGPNFANNAENSYHVLFGSQIDSTAILNGFTITAGNADINSWPNNAGGGMYNYNSHPMLRDVTFSSNSAEGNGGGMLNELGSNSTLMNVTFSGNTAFHGGGIHNYLAGMTLTNVTFWNNSAAFYGGAILNGGSSPTLMNVTFSGNSAFHGGGIYNENGGAYNNITGNPRLTNVILWNDMGVEIVNLDSSTTNISYSAIQGGCPAASTCTKLITDDPMLAPIANNGGFTETMALGVGSSAINRGMNSSCPNDDQRGVTRPQGSRCDIGAVEFEATFTTSSVNSVALQDGWILESTETSNKGGSKNNTASTFNLGDNAANKQYRGILSFDTSSLPGDAFITNVTLNLKRAAVVGGSNPINIFKGFMVDLRNGDFGTAALELGDFKAAGNMILGPFKPALIGGGYSLDLSAANLQINRTGDTQIRLRFKLDDNNNLVANYLKLYSGNAAEADRPQLLIEYYLP
jgi:predicted outer membrane repeat protein